LEAHSISRCGQPVSHYLFWLILFFYSNQTLTYSYVNKQEKMRRVWELSS
jgi:hypothetical protein